MNSVIDKYNTLVGILITILTSVFGAYWYVFAAYFICTVLDYATGWYKARVLHQESSSIGMKGIIKKVGYWVIIMLAFLVGNVFVHMGRDVLNLDLSFLKLIGWFTLACLMINEIRSILENLVECGLHVPEVLIKGLAVAQKLLEQDEDDTTIIYKKGE